MSAVDEYVAELDRNLYGQVRKKADLLTEARDSLTDAAEAYQAAGYDDAEQRAVADFGDVRLIAGEYQAELGVSAGVHALHMMMLMIPAMQGLFDATRLVSFGDWSKMTTAMPSWYIAIAGLHNAVSGGAAVLGALALLGTRFLGRWLRARVSPGSRPSC